VLAVGQTQVGAREATGRNDGPAVQKYLKSIGLSGSYAWCSAYIVWIFRAAGVPVPRFGRARSWFDAAHTVWRGGQQVRGRPAPQPADLVGFRWGNPQIAHVGLLEIWGTGPTCQTNEGNTSGGRADRDGEGSFINWRSKWMVSAVANPIANPKYSRGE
jgi:hypothetical protein